MPPTLALLLCVLLVAYLFLVDRTLKPRVSPGLWIPLLWLLMIGSREVSQWLHLQANVTASDYYIEGNETDRWVYTSLIVAGLLVLLKRKTPWTQAMSRNAAVALFFLYCGLSILWSDYPLVSLKRWIKEIGMLIMVLVVLTDLDPREAVNTLLRRWSYVLIPFSVLLVKYYPELGKGYSSFTGQAFFSGVTTSKNSLGALCLIAALCAAWTFVSRKERPEPVRGAVLLNCLLLSIMAFWLAAKANSATAFVCFCAGITVLALVRMSKGRVKHLGPVIVVLALVIAGVGTLLDAWTLALSLLGRDTTLTGRTDIWSKVLKSDINPLFGTGFESFWLGTRAAAFWEDYEFRINQAHNGYLEVYLNLGLVGIAMLTLMMLSAYRKIARRLSEDVDFSSFRLACLVIVVLLNIAEASFMKLGPIWFIALLITLEQPAMMAQSTVPLEHPKCRYGAFPPRAPAPVRVQPRVSRSGLRRNR